MGATGARVLVEWLARRRVERIFTLSGNQILSIYDACLDAGIALTDTRHEAAAAHMADAWARLRDEPGVCLVSAGPGHTNTLTAVANALASESPVLWLSGGSDERLAGQGGFQEMDQVGLAAPVCKAAWKVREVADLPAALDRAWRTMLEGRPGPVHLTLPSDLLARAASGGDSLAGGATGGAAGAATPRRQPAEPVLVARARNRLAAAERPLIVAGPAVARGAAGRALAALSAATGLPWLALESPRGLTDPALHHLGKAVPAADVVLLLAPQDYTLAFAGPKALAPEARLIEVAPTAAELGRNRPPALGLVGDALSVLEQLRAGSADHAWNTAEWRAALAERRAAGRASLAALERTEQVPIHPLRLAAETRALLPPGAVVTQDGGEFAQWSRWAFGDSEQVTIVNGKFGMIGPAVPFAIGAALARPGRPVVAFVGDGTAGYHLLEFDTAVRHGIPFVAVIGNDAGWAAERHRQLALYGRERVVAADLLPSRYDEVARALGAVGEFVQTPADLRPALARALASGRPACVNVLIDSLPSPADPV